MVRVTAGVDLGGTKIQTVVFDGRGVIGSDRVLTPQTGAPEVMAAIVDTVKASLAQAGLLLKGLQGAGIGTPGEIDAQKGVVSLAANVPGFVDAVPLGPTVSKALGNRRGINRAGYFVMPMDETLAVAAVDLGGRPHTVVDLQVKLARVGDLQTELVHDFFEGFSIGARANVHVKVLYGRSSHHKIEAVFKAFARALRVACAKDRRLARMLPSTKGLL